MKMPAAGDVKTFSTFEEAMQCVREYEERTVSHFVIVKHRKLKGS
jgi:hypothetical protein